MKIEPRIVSIGYSNGIGTIEIRGYPTSIVARVYGLVSEIMDNSGPWHFIHIELNPPPIRKSDDGWLCIARFCLKSKGDFQ